MCVESSVIRKVCGEYATRFKYKNPASNTKAIVSKLYSSINRYALKVVSMFIKGIPEAGRWVQACLNLIDNSASRRICKAIEKFLLF